MAETVLLCDSQSLARIGLTTILAGCDDVDVVGQADTIDQAVLLAKELRPELIFADMEIQGADGVELTRAILDSSGTIPAHAEASRPRIALLVSRVDARVIEALRIGALGALLRNEAAGEVLRAVQEMRRGFGFLSPAIARYVLDQFGGRSLTSAGNDAARTLTGREQQILALVADGYSNAEIARQTYVYESTVKFHVSQILKKLGLRDRLQAAAFAYRNGLTG